MDVPTTAPKLARSPALTRYEQLEIQEEYLAKEHEKASELFWAAHHKYIKGFPSGVDSWSYWQLAEKVRVLEEQLELLNAEFDEEEVATRAFPQPVGHGDVLGDGARKRSRTK